MTEIFDQLIIRLFFAIYICILIYLYKYINVIIYPNTQNQILKKIHPPKNPTEVLHLFSRILGIGIIFSSLEPNLEDGLLYALFDLTFKTSMDYILFLISIFILESIALYNFEYKDEIMKRKNIAYAIISFSQTIALAMLLKNIFDSDNIPLIGICFLWLTALVVIGFASKSYKYISNLTFNKLLIQKNLALAFSYSGFILGCAIIIISSFSDVPEFLQKEEFQKSAYSILSKILLSIIIFPLFIRGFSWTFNLKIYNQLVHQDEKSLDHHGPEFAYGIYEGTLFFTASYLTTVITEQIYFGTIYPIF